MHCQPQLMYKVYKWLNFDRSCLLCDEFTDNRFALCSPCEEELPWLREQCRRCALPLAMDGLLCAQCSRRRPAFSRVEVPWLYQFPLDSLITRFKHHNAWPFGRLLAELLGQWLQHRYACGLVRPDCLMPVPLSAARLRQRGFNQAQWLAQWLARSLDVPCDARSLRRTRDTTAQQDLSARARRRNLHQAFCLSPAARVEGLHIALVDDVLTTGATSQALASCLIQAGARRVDVYCLARTPRPGPA
jgi:ComF family protein